MTNCTVAWASQYKDYVLTLLFMKYISDKYGGDPYADIVVPEGGSFQDMVALKGNRVRGGSRACSPARAPPQ